MNKLAALSLIILLLAACGVSTPYPEPPPSPQVTELPPGNWPTATPGGPALVQAFNIYDCDGNVTTPAWLAERFGAVTWTISADDITRLSAIYARCGDQAAVIVAHIQRTSGDPVQGQTVVFSWPDAPLLPEALQDCGLTRGVYGPTNEQGNIGFGLGRGAFYWPPAGGPHTLFVPGGSCVAGLGMIAGSNHEHVDLGFTAPDVTLGGGVDWGYSPGTLVDPKTNTVTWPGMP